MRLPRNPNDWRRAHLVMAAKRAWIAFRRFERHAEFNEAGRQINEDAAEWEMVLDHHEAMAKEIANVLNLCVALPNGTHHAGTRRFGCKPVTGDEK